MFIHYVCEPVCVSVFVDVAVFIDENVLLSHIFTCICFLDLIYSTILNHKQFYTVSFHREVNVIITNFL